MNKISIVKNPHNLPDGGRVIQWHGKRPARIQLEIGLILRLSQATGLYVPEKQQILI